MSMSEPEWHFYDRLQKCVRNTKLPTEEARKAKRMMRSAQRYLKNNCDTEDVCYDFCFVSELMDIIEYLTKSET